MPPPTRRAALAEVFCLDLRSLGLMRILLGATLLVDLVVLRLPWLGHFYTDAGVLARGALPTVHDRAWTWSPHFLSGGLPWQLALHLVGVGAALGLLLGWRTRACQVVAWLFVCSLQARNPMIMDRGDFTLRLLLFWSLPLPLGARFGLDAARGATPPPRSDRRSDVFTAGFVCQLVLLYLFAALHKTGPEWTRDGTALAYSLSMRELVRPLGTWLLAFPELLRFLTTAVLGLEYAAPLALLSPWGQPWMRLAATGALLGLHVGILALFAIGIFPYHSMAGLVGLLPSLVWEGRGAPKELPVGRRSPWALGAWGLLIGYTAMWNLASLPESSLEISPAGRKLGYLLRLDQHWDVYSPAPPRRSTWWVIEVLVDDGSRFDLFTGAPPRFDLPRDVRTTFPSQYHWRTMHLFRFPTHAAARLEVARGWLRLAQGAAPAGRTVTGLRVHRMNWPTRLDGRTPRVFRTTMVEIDAGGAPLSPGAATSPPPAPPGSPAAPPAPAPPR